MLQLVKTLKNDLLHFAFPNLCEACQSDLVGNEFGVCLTCWQYLPKTNFHLQPGNELEQKMIGRIRIERAASFFYFNHDSRIQEILHSVKYQRKKELVIEIGKRYGNELLKCNWIKDFDCIIPIPLAKQKLKQRGFNQSEYFGKGLSEALHIIMDTESVIRIKNTKTQTAMNMSERLENVKDAFTVCNAERLQNKHILLIDDVVTTGATLESCALAIREQVNVKVSFLTIAYAII